MSNGVIEVGTTLSQELNGYHIKFYLHFRFTYWIAWLHDPFDEYSLHLYRKHGISTCE